MDPSAGSPLILTATLPPALAAEATALRQQHFPPERNFLSAHVTLFHALPPSARGEVERLLAGLAAEFAPVPARLTGTMSLGGGTALRIESAPMLALRSMISAAMRGMLTAQDQGGARLHITVQNKVTPAAARALQDVLSTQIVPRSFAFTGLALHHYRGGPWEPAGQWSFRGTAAAG